ncbi:MULTISPECIES: hypothetical protein [unclassified Mesorhizobium]|uniref:hypothetical protein n=1 Tax=unclassified Mesorhizobium TaxID=325217 RepID=UPI00112856BF|nr:MULTISPECIES: hypothetical protein [unclassified Mesorhizobium]TPK42639.1 hypothetical protein FJ550_29735 [Mesorhizobium sp. B2-5-2]TPL26759.1 hypothetical protein FJ946_13055 [Mesorhizobium sp. B2-4-7]TPL40537.1 hypothetical protein FJ961_17355 [Mesorhizobium sp. B2-4-5]TPM76811.1 hypothetical protein FJ968_03585 [Mesorhizobium sp. B2-1-6]TPN72474.1 hypothetical protein FJ985_29240 [Mesorhizobium sp. B1-1-2]
MTGIEIVLDGMTETLLPSASATIAISRRAGGMVPALERVMKFDSDMITGAIALGLMMDPGTVAEKISRSNVAELMPAVADFITILCNGGRIIDDEEPAPKHWAAPADQ